MQAPWSFWIGFNAFVILMLALDLGVFNRKAHRIRIREAIAWTAVWIFLAMCFNAMIWYWEGKTKALEFFTGYIIEKSLSLDNIFVFALIFSYFHTPAIHQHKILFWGIIGALIMRAVFIFAGVAILERFHWVIYIFAAILIFTGIKMMSRKREVIQLEKNFVLRMCKRIFPVDHEDNSGRFFIVKNKKRYVTSLFVVLLVVESTDLFFALDSIPAILAITEDRFIVYTSNVFAILGLRSLYFALAGIIDKFRYLSAGLSFILIFVGIKMLINTFYQIPVHLTLLVIVTIISISIISSIIANRRENGKQAKF